MFLPLGLLCSNCKKFVVDNQFFWVWFATSSECVVRAKILMHQGYGSSVLRRIYKHLTEGAIGLTRTNGISMALRAKKTDFEHSRLSPLPKFAFIKGSLNFVLGDPSNSFGPLQMNRRVKHGGYL